MRTPMKADEFFATPYSERQLITFVEDSELDNYWFKRNDFTQGVSGLSIFATAGVCIIFAVPALFSFPLIAASGPVVYRICRHFYPKEAKKPLGRILLIRKTWSPQFTLPPGHPRGRVVFAGHPAEPQNYIPIADFHRYTFEHKFSEILSILMHLGAKKIEVSHVRGWGQDFSEKLSINIPKLSISMPKIELTQQAGVSQRKQSTILYEAELSGGKTVSMPNNLVWFPHESTWKQVVEGRTKFGLKTFSLYLQYQEDYGINVGLGTSVVKTGLDLGGKFEQYESTTWEIRGTFL